MTKYQQLSLKDAPWLSSKVFTAPIEEDSSMNDFRSFEEMINEGDEDSLKFEAYAYGPHSEVPFQNKQRYFAYNR